MNPDPFTLTDAALSAVLNGGYQGILLTVLVYLGLKLFRRVNATTRYFVWLTTLTVVAALPIAQP